VFFREPIDYVVETVKEETVWTRQNTEYIENNQTVGENLGGYLISPLMEVSLPVMKETKPTKEIKSFTDYYYLTHDAEGNYSRGGSLFVMEGIDTEEGNIVTVFGHNMINKTMFGNLERYFEGTPEGVNKYVRFDTPENKHYYEIVAGAQVKGTDLRRFDYYTFDSFDTFEDFEVFKDKLGSMLLFGDISEMNRDEHYLLLSTCNTTGSERRIAIFKRVDLGETYIAEHQTVLTPQTKPSVMSGYIRIAALMVGGGLFGFLSFLIIRRQRRSRQKREEDPLK
jgi:hypothetical protein